MHYAAGSIIQVSSLELLMVPVILGACEVDNRTYYAGDMIVADDGDVIEAITDLTLGLVRSTEWTCCSTVDEVLLVAE